MIVGKLLGFTGHKDFARKACLISVNSEEKNISAFEFINQCWYYEKLERSQSW